MIHRKISSFFLILSFFICSFLNAGFIEGTGVKTPRGFVPIQELQIDDVVYAYDTQTNEFILRTIVATSCHAVSSIIHIQANDKHIFADAKQRFYRALEKKWCKAKDLQPGMVLQNYHGQKILVKKVTALQCSTKVHDLALDTPHSFCVTADGIVVHNFGILVPIAVFGAEGITIVTGFGYSLLCGVGAALLYHFLSETTGASIDPNLTISNANFLPAQEPNFNHAPNYNSHPQEYSLTAYQSHVPANNAIFTPQKSSDNFGSSSFEKYPGVHDTRSFPAAQLPTTNACLAPEKNNYVPEISTCPPYEEEKLPTLGCGLSLPPTPEPLLGGCLPEPVESDIIRCPGVLGGWEPEDVETRCNWGRYQKIPGLAEMHPESSDEEENPDELGHEESQTGEISAGENKEKGQSAEIPENERKKRSKPPKESARPWDLPDHDPAIDIEKIDFSLTPHLTEEEIELIKECIRRFFGVEGLLANDSPLWRILKFKEQKKGALFELEYIIELSNQGSNVIKMGYEVHISDGLVEIDIETDTELIECKSGVWETKRENKIDQLEKKLIRAKRLSEKLQKSFIVVSRESIPTVWKNWLNQNDIEHKEWQP